MPGSAPLRTTALVVTSILLTIGLGTAALASRTGQALTQQQGSRTILVASLFSGWPKAAQDAAAFMRRKYGPPAAGTPDMLIWERTGPWKRTIVYRLEYPHQFPTPHVDVMQQWIDYQADPKTFDELTLYDGSVVLERTSGEMSARSDTEAANFLALNLAHEVATGRRSVDDARRIYGEQMILLKAGEPAPLAETIIIPRAQGTNDPGRMLSERR